MKTSFIKKLPKEKLQQVVFICVVMLATIVGVVNFYVLKNWSALTEINANIDKINDDIVAAERRTRGAQSDVAHRAEVKSFVEAQKGTMVSGDPFAWVVREFTLLAQQHPVQVSGLHPGAKIETAANSKNRTYTAGIDLSGTYDQIGTFVRDLENKFPTAEIRALSMSGSAEDQGQHNASLTIVLRVRPPEPVRKTEVKKSA
ncbi:MAG TPA: hypothetical protein VMP11_17695 [Verrucomicrobiae bacterium]|nr:hypothetical protein [Verrucomicrobiae bacterium]